MKKNLVGITLLLVSALQMYMYGMEMPNGFNFGSDTRSQREQMAADEAFARLLAQEEGMEGYVNPAPAAAVVEIQPPVQVVKQDNAETEATENVFPFTVYVSGKNDDQAFVSEVAAIASFDYIARQLESIIDGKRIAEKAVDKELLRLTLISMIKEALADFGNSSTTRSYAMTLPNHTINEANLVTDAAQLAKMKAFVSVAINTILLKKIAPLELSYWANYTTGKDVVLYLDQDKLNILNDYAQFVEILGIALFSPISQKTKQAIVAYQGKRIEKLQLPATIKVHARNLIAVTLKNI